ncbi:CYTH domain-containing protein [Candidatus Dojkabacteria bacterium]|jgi:CYTH domain-containing protein|nr:CYTH domain-containing protein [Candidatus Dojkabacteria bacterium]
MGKEIERKFLVNVENFQFAKDLSKCLIIEIIQGYLSDDKNKVVRIRLEKTFKDVAYITIKSSVTGISRDEFEYEIPYNDGLELIKLCDKVIEKTRYKYYPVVNLKSYWEIDIFKGDNEGLIVAEIELENEDEVFYKPDWILEEVTGDPIYYNSNLVNYPYKTW